MFALQGIDPKVNRLPGRRSKVLLQARIAYLPNQLSESGPWTAEIEFLYLGIDQAVDLGM
ncbi:MAG: hypothetical protein CMN59_11475 [Sphingobium sp.]|nr:hypothetical protein [Sphingobium sp.]